MALNEKTYEYITLKLIERMEQGELVWRKNWKDVRAPRNGETGRVYENFYNLMVTHGRYTLPFWYTFNQISRLKGHLKQVVKDGVPQFKVDKETGEPVLNKKGEPVPELEHATCLLQYYPKEIETEKLVVNPATGKEERQKKTLWLARGLLVWNIDQIDGIKAPALPEAKDNEANVAADQILAKYPKPPRMSESKDNACYYMPAFDEICMVHITGFTGSDEYYSTLFHENVHSTGHSSRLDRQGIRTGHFGNETYSYEELVAEIGAAFLCAEAGISNEVLEKNQAAYLQNWLKRLKGDKTWLMKAMNEARDAVKYVHGETAPKSKVKMEAEAGEMLANA